MKKLLIILLFLSTSLLLNTATLNVANGQNSQFQNNYSGGREADCNTAEGEVCLDDPLSGATPQALIGKIINAALGIVGSIALLMFIYGGFVWMTAAGNEQSVAKGKGVLVWATIGLIIIFSSYALVKFVFTGLGVG